MVRSRLARPLRALVPAALAAAVAAGSLTPTLAVAVTPRPSVERAPIALDAASDTSVATGATAVADAPAVTPAPAADTVGQHPSAAYLEAMAHEGDQINFTPGAAVEVGFTPRADDTWPVDGKHPVALPSGRATGRQMAATPEGTVWAATGDPVPTASAIPGAPTAPAATDAPVDAPANGSAVPATGAAWTTPAAVDTTASVAAGLRRQVFGFLPYWELSGATSKLNLDVLSTVAYFSVGAYGNGDLKKTNADGSLTTGWAGWTSSSMTSVINAAHQRGTRVVLTLSVFAWTSTQVTVQRTLLGSAAARLNFAQQAAAAVRDRGADGINLDFEPVASGYDDEFVLLLKTVRAELNRVKAGYQLTYDTTGSIGNYPLEASVAAGAADAIFIMGYDYRIAGSNYAGSIDPLSGGAYDLADTIRAYTARVSPSRIILGLPWYGRAWSTVSDSVRSRSQSGEQYGYSTTVNYETVVDLVAQYGHRWDAEEQAPYVVYQRQNCTTTYGCVTSWRQVYYDDAESMMLRFALVNSYGLRGAGLWALGYDGGHPELYHAISDSFLVDKSAPQAGIRLLSNRQLDEGFVVSWPAQDTSTIAKYDVQASADGGAWTNWLIGTTLTSDVFAGDNGHGYAFRVRATDTKGNVGAWNVTAAWTATPALAPGGFGRVATDGLAYRTGPSTSAARLGSLAAGTLMAITSGPVVADGFTWYEVTQPIAEWSPVSFVEQGVWVAASSPGGTYVTAFRAPNSTIVDAGIRDLDFATGSATGAASAALRQLSPEGDGTHDTLRLRWTAAFTFDSLVLNVYRPDGTLVGTQPVPVTAAGARTWDWDGRLNGSLVADGSYALQLVGTVGAAVYRAPSARPTAATQLAAYGVTVDTTDPVIGTATTSVGLISPNGDGTRDGAAITLAATGATAWTLAVANAGGTVVRSLTGAGGRTAMTWNGTDDGGALVPDGAYTITLTVTDDAGNAAIRSLAMTVDTTAPAVAQTLSRDAFTPNGDGSGDIVTLAWTSAERAAGTARVYHGTTLVRTWTVALTAAWSATWDGRNAAGAAVSDGTYAFKVDVRDAAGNRTLVSRGVVVDRSVGFLRWSRNFFPQDADTALPTSNVTFKLVRHATVSMGLYDASGVLVRTVWTNLAMDPGAKTWSWSGKLPGGAWAPQGRYTARLRVTTSLGTQELVRPVWAAAFSVTASSASVRAGDILTLAFAPVEGLSTRPVLTFTQPGLAGVVVTATRLANGTYRAAFSVAAGTPGAATVKITAKDAFGHTNTMTVPVAIVP